MTDEKELIYAYLAGFIDADGSITIIKTSFQRQTKNGIKKTIQYRVKLTAHNCKLAPIELLKQEFGANFIRSKKTGKAKNHDNWRPCYEWTLTSTKAADALKALLPYLRIKKEQALICLEMDEFRKSYSPVQRRWNDKFSQECDQKFEKWKLKCNVLNKRGQDVNQNDTELPHPQVDLI